MQVFHLKIEAAAERIGCGETKMKSLRRAFGLARWPSREITAVGG